MKRIVARTAVLLASLAALGGCAVVPYQQADYPAPYPPYSYGQPVYAAPVAPAPVYSGPPVYFGFDFLFRGGHGGHRHGGHWHGGHRHR